MRIELRSQSKLGIRKSSPPPINVKSFVDKLREELAYKESYDSGTNKEILKIFEDILTTLSNNKTNIFDGGNFKDTLKFIKVIKNEIKDNKKLFDKLRELNLLTSVENIKDLENDYYSNIIEIIINLSYSSISDTEGNDGSTDVKELKNNINNEFKKENFKQYFKENVYKISVYCKQLDILNNKILSKDNNSEEYTDISQALIDELNSGSDSLLRYLQDIQRDIQNNTLYNETTFNFKDNDILPVAALEIFLRQQKATRIYHSNDYTDFFNNALYALLASYYTLLRMINPLPKSGSKIVFESYFNYKSIRDNFNSLKDLESIRNFNTFIDETIKNFEKIKQACKTLDEYLQRQGKSINDFSSIKKLIDGDNLINKDDVASLDSLEKFEISFNQAKLHCSVDNEGSSYVVKPEDIDEEKLSDTISKIITGEIITNSINKSNDNADDTSKKSTTADPNNTQDKNADEESSWRDFFQSNFDYEAFYSPFERYMAGYFNFLEAEEVYQAIASYNSNWLEAAVKYLDKHSSKVKLTELHAKDRNVAVAQLLKNSSKVKLDTNVDEEGYRFVNINGETYIFAIYRKKNLLIKLKYDPMLSEIISRDFFKKKSNNVKASIIEKVILNLNSSASNNSQPSLDTAIENFLTPKEQKNDQQKNDLESYCKALKGFFSDSKNKDVIAARFMFYVEIMKTINNYHGDFITIGDTEYRICKNPNEYLQYAKAISRDIISGIDELNYEDYLNIESLHIKSREKRQYQIDFTKRIIQFLLVGRNISTSFRNRSIIGVAPCGSGKTDMLSVVVTYMLHHSLKKGINLF